MATSNKLVDKQKANVYAQTLLEAAKQAGGKSVAVQICEEVENIDNIYRTNVHLLDTLKGESFSAEERATLARNVFAGVHDILVDVLVVMAQRDELSLFNRVAKDYTELMRTQLNIIMVNVTTAVALDDYLRELITKKLTKEYNLDIVLHETVDPSILGGIQITANGSRLNASVRWHLENARTLMKQ